MSDEEARMMKINSEFEQASARMADTCPPMWRRLYCNSVIEGFTEYQAMELVKTFILGMWGTTPKR